MALNIYGMNSVGHTASSGGASMGGSGSLVSGLGGRRKKAQGAKRQSRHTSGPRRDHGGLKGTGSGPTPPSGGGVTHAGMRTPGMRGASTTPHKGPGSPPHGGPGPKSAGRSKRGPRATRRMNLFTKGK